MIEAIVLPAHARPTRVLLVASLASSLRNFRGPLIAAMIGRGHEVHVAAPGLLQDPKTLAWLHEVGATAHEIGLARAGLSPLTDIKSLLQLYFLMQRVRPGLFIGYTIKPVIWGLLAARWARVPRRVALITGLGYAFTGDARGKRAVIRRLVGQLYSIALKRSTLVFFQNDDDRADFAAMGLLPSGAPICVVAGSGIDLAAFPTQPLPEGPPRFLLIARLLGDKGIREYAQAAQIVRQDWPEVEFHLVGGTDPNPAGIPESEVRTWHAAGDVHWHGAQTDVRPFLAQSHVYVLPSYREGTPRTVLEAMATGRAVITADAPGCRQTVEPGQTGYLVPLRDSTALANVMMQFLHDPALIERFGTAGRARAEALYDVDHVNADMLRAMGLDNNAKS